MDRQLPPGSRVRVKDTPELRRIRRWPCGRYGTVLSYHSRLFGGPVNLYRVQIDRGEKVLIPPEQLIPVRARKRTEAAQTSAVNDFGKRFAE